MKQIFLALILGYSTLQANAKHLDDFGFAASVFKPTHFSNSDSKANRKIASEFNCTAYQADSAGEYSPEAQMHLNSDRTAYEAVIGDYKYRVIINSNHLKAMISLKNRSYLLASIAEGTMPLPAIGGDGAEDGVWLRGLPLGSTSEKALVSINCK